jgi:RNA polymerase sigma-70 factor (ECF subfamily)
VSENTIGSPQRWLADHGTALYRFALVRLRDPAKAEDAVQETLLAAWHGRERFTGGASVRTWLIGILRHKISDEFRREQRETPASDPDPPARDEHDAGADFTDDGHWASGLADWGDPEAALDQQQFWATLERCLDTLPRRQARLFVLREVMEEETEIICQDLGVTPTNLWTMLYRARLALRHCPSSIHAHRGLPKRLLF